MSAIVPPPQPCSRQLADPDQHYLPMSKVVPPAPCGSSTAHRADDARMSRRAVVDIKMVPDQASCEGTTTIVLLFSQDVTSPPSVVIEDNEVLDDVMLLKINSRSFKFTAPRHAEGSVDVLVRTGGQLKESRHRLSYVSSSLRLSRGLTLLYVRQLNAACELVLRQHEKPVADPRTELDRALASSIGDTSSTDTVPAFVYEELFGIYKSTSATDTDDMNGSCDKPTLLHLAAAHGLTALAVRLTDLPDSNLATVIKDNQGRVPGEVARQNGHTNAAAVFARLTANSIGGGGNLSGSSSSLAKSESNSDISSRRNNSQKDRPESKQDGITRVHSGTFPPNNDVYQKPPPPRPVSKDSWTSRSSSGSARDSGGSRNSAEARDSGVRSSQSSGADDDEEEDRDGEDGVDSSYMDMTKMVDDDAPPSSRAPPPPTTRPQRSNSTAVPPPKPRCTVPPRSANSVYDVPKPMNDYDVPRHHSDSSSNFDAPPSTKAPPPPIRGGSESRASQPPPPLAPRQDPSAPPVTPRRDVLIRSTAKSAGHHPDPPERPGLPPRPTPAGGASSNRRPSLQAAMNNQQLC